MVLAHNGKANKMSLRFFSYSSNLQCQSSVTSINELLSSTLRVSNYDLSTSSPALASQTRLFSTHKNFTDEFIDSELSPTNYFSQPLFNPINPSVSVFVLSSNSSSLYTNASSILSPLSSTFEDPPSPSTDDQLKPVFADFILHQQQFLNSKQPLTIHQITHSASTSETCTSSIRNTPTWEQRILMKSKYPTNPPRYLVRSPSLPDSSKATKL